MKDKLSIGLNSYNNFSKLPERAKILFFYALEEIEWFGNFIEVCCYDYEYCKSPVEILFNFAFDIMSFQFGAKSIIYLEPQVKIVTKEGKKYFADFEMRIQKNGEDIPTKILIEVDGHDFHEKTKQQVAYDKERELNIKMEGYDIIRFSGSQVWNDPLKCAADSLEYLQKKVGDKYAE